MMVVVVVMVVVAVMVVVVVVRRICGRVGMWRIRISEGAVARVRG